jgi:hypothetical protein
MYIFNTFSKYLFLGFKVHYVHFRAFLLKNFFGYAQNSCYKYNCDSTDAELSP